MNIKNVITENVSPDIFIQTSTPEEYSLHPISQTERGKAVHTLSVSHPNITYTCNVKTCSKNHVLLVCWTKKKRKVILFPL